MFANVRIMLVWLVLVLGINTIIIGAAALAEEVRITADTLRAEFTLGKKSYVIERNQDNKNVLTGTYAKTSRSCPPFCIHPMLASSGVVTVGELEIINFLKNNVSKGTGLLVDARIPSWHKKGTIPGAVNIPFTLFSKKNPYLDELLPVLGAKRIDGDRWDFSKSKELMLFCNGPWCDQSPRSIRGLRQIGYPAEKLFYYRGGMQNWVLLGLSTHIPDALVTKLSTNNSERAESVKQ